jgi:hypothetical protein
MLRLMKDCPCSALTDSDGQRVNYVHMGYGSGYEQYLVVRVERGVAGTRRESSHVEFTAFRRAPFEAFMKTTEYRDMLRSEQMKAGADSLKDPADIYQHAVLWATVHWAINTHAVAEAIAEMWSKRINESIGLV